VKCRGQQRPISVLEADPMVGELALEHGELVSKYQALGVLVVVAAWQ
jgi:hypothetical protein